MLKNIRNVPIPTPDSWYSEKSLELSKNNKHDIKSLYHVKMNYDPRDLSSISFVPSFDLVLQKHLKNNKEDNALYM